MGVCLTVSSAAAVAEVRQGQWQGWQHCQEGLGVLVVVVVVMMGGSCVIRC